MSENKVLKERQEIDNQYKWDLSVMFDTDLKWEEAYQSVTSGLKDIGRFEGILGESAETLYNFLEKKEALSRILSDVYVYARMKKDENNNETKYQAMSERSQTLAVEYSMALSFVTPELLAVPKEKIFGFIETKDELKIYTHYFEDMYRHKSHVLPKEQEALMAQFGEMMSAPQNIFGMINNADIKFGSIQDEEGETVEVTHGKYIKFLESPNRQVRKDAFEALFSAYEQQKNTIASTFNYNVKGDVLSSRIRKYDSALDSALKGDNIEQDVYDNLIQVAHDHIHLLHRYIKLRKKILKVDELHVYDLYTPLVKDMDKKVSYQDGLDLIRKGLAPMGEDYLEIMNKGFSSKWIDVYENKGKTSGAYSFGTYDSPPYIMLNYTDTVKDVFTVAHEMGHSMHSYFTRNNQPPVYGSYSIFTAEVASTVNESLLMAYMINEASDVEEKKYLINHFMEQFRATFFRQTMFAEFEKITHEAVEKGEVLTVDWLCDKYYELNKFYYGDDLVHDDLIRMEWARIPHFYNAFYVYKYATGYSAAIELSRQIREEGDVARERYVNFLKSGDSDYPINLLKSAGVDMSKTTPIENAMKTFEKLVEEFEQFV